MNTQKKIKKNIILFLALLIFAGGNLLAQSRQSRPKVPNKEEIQNLVTELAKELSLTSGQKNDIENLFVKHFEEVKQKMKEHKEKMENEKEKMDKRRKEFEDSIKNLLNEKQQVQFDEFMKNHKPHKENSKQTPPLIQ
jgi:hypothetical protein